MTAEATTTILVADDDLEILSLVSRHLQSAFAARVLEASDGEEALKMARDERPDVVILDVMMPGMSGWEVCRGLRDEPSLAGVGIMMLTGIGERLNEMTSPLYGADDYLDKPFELQDLEEKVRALIDGRAQS